ncbi:PO113 protein, partial [Jacana jacana]|nr:PO113 protein [Jacana jacana]
SCAEGNHRADKLTQPVFVPPPPDTWRQAQVSHSFFHQSAKVLKRQFHLSMSEAKGIVQACPDCQQYSEGPRATVNLRGLHSLKLWQTDVTHIPEFGCLRYVHVSIDTYSMAVCFRAL